MMAVFPLGLFLGWVTWRSGSLFPAMMGHFVNNFVSVMHVSLAPETDLDALALPSAPITAAILGIGTVSLIAVAIASTLYGREKTDTRHHHSITTNEGAV